ncbi:hypothetical protein Tco_0879374 [Tanacetum coccineum]
MVGVGGARQQSQIIKLELDNLQQNPPSIHSESSNTHSPQQSIPKKKRSQEKNGPKRGKNVEDEPQEPVAAGRWLPVEEELLATCYVAVSEDNNVGRSQKHERLYRFETSSFEKNSKPYEDLLTSKWYTVNANWPKIQRPRTNGPNVWRKSGEYDVELFETGSKYIRVTIIEGPAFHKKMLGRFEIPPEMGRHGTELLNGAPRG